MAIKNIRPNVVYGLSNPLQNMPPTSIITNHDPSVHDFSDIGTLWINKTAQTAFVLVNIAGGEALWNSLAAVIPSDLTVDNLTVTDETLLEGIATIEGLATFEGGITSTGTNTISMSADAEDTTIRIGTGAAFKDIIIGTTSGGSEITIRAGFFALLSAATIDITAINNSFTMQSGTGTMSLSTDTAATNILIGTGTAAKTITLGSTTAGSTLALQTATGTAVTAANGITISTAGRGVTLPGGPVLITGTGSPDTVVTAARGSLFIRTDPVDGNSRLYINTNASTTWTAIPAVA